MDRSKAFFINICGLIAGALFYALAQFVSDIFLIPSLILLGGALAVNLIFNRCPGCGRWLGRLPIYIQCCPYCGEYL